MLPSESDLARIIGRDVDPLAIHQARKALRKAIGTRLYAAFLDIYRDMEIRGPYSPAPEQAGRRALRNVALGYLTSRRRPEDIARAAAHFAQSTQPDRRDGRAVDAGEHQRAGAGRERWRGSTSAGRATTSSSTAGSPVRRPPRSHRRWRRSRGSRAHPLFSIKNPNKVRALIGAFACGQSGTASTGPTARATTSWPTGCWRSTPSTRRSRRGCSPPSAAGGCWSPSAGSAREEGAAAHRQDQAPLQRRIRDRIEDARVGWVKRSADPTRSSASIALVGSSLRSTQPTGLTGRGHSRHIFARGPRLSTIACAVIQNELSDSCGMYVTAGSDVGSNFLTIRSRKG